jgi:hypothetical protein
VHPSTNASRDADTFVIAGADTLARFRRESALVLNRGAYRHIAVTLPVARRAQFETRINGHYRQCGCVASAISVLLTLAALVLWNTVYSVRPSYGWGDVALDAGVVLLAGALGKVLALGHAHWALKQTLRDLAVVVDAHHSEGELHDRVP